MTSMSVRPLLSVPADGARPKAPARAIMSPWRWAVVTCVLLGISAGFRYWREWQFAALAARSEACPFPLAELPRAMGTWRAAERAETKLDPEVARFAGASDHVVREYIDEKTGEQASVLVLYGLGYLVSPHTPNLCYTAAGYRAVRGPIDGSIAVPGLKDPVHYRWAIYTKRTGHLSRYEETYVTFLHRGDWLPDAASARWKMFRYDPGLFKVQIARDVSGLSESGKGPCEDLLKEIAAHINGRLPGKR
jgi:hypothetical protein